MGKTGTDPHLICHKKRRWASAGETNLRWPKTVFMHDHFIHSTPALSVIFFSIIEHSVLTALVFYYKDMLEKVTMQRTWQFSAFSSLPKEPS